MKITKKIINMLLVLAMLLVELVPTTKVLAQSGTNADNGTITIANAIEGKTYSVYEILKLESYDTTKGAYTYTVTNDSWKEFINSSTIKNVYVEVNDQGIVTWKNGADKVAFSKLALQYAKDHTIKATASVTATKKEGETKVVAEFTGLNLGYYLVDSSVGALCGLTTTKPNATVKEKNGIPTIEKKVKEDSTGLFGETNTDDIGKTIYFKTTINVEAGAENYVLYDNMSAGLTLNNNSIEVKLVSDNETTVVDVTNYVVTFDTKISEDSDATYTFVIDFTKAFEDTLKAGDKIVVTYNAVLNKDAVVGGEGNPNETWLTYGDKNETTHDKTITYTYSFDLVKTDKENVLLDGAEFELYNKENKKIELVLVDAAKNIYRVATSEDTNKTTTIVVTNGKVTIKGLDNDSYHLHETKAPEGYNKLTSDVNFTINSANLDATTGEVSTSGGTVIKYTSGGVHVINYTGAELPETGGIGTVLFITIGSLLVLGFGVLLVTKLRMSKISA